MHTGTLQHRLPALPKVALQLATLCFASVTAFAADHQVVPGTQANTNNGVFDDGDTITFTTSLTPCSSYCCSIYSDDELAGVSFASVKLGSQDIPYSRRGDVEPLMANFVGVDNADQRVCFVLSDSSAGTVRLEIDVLGGGTVSEARVSCDETILSGGFNTSVTEFNFLQLTNTTSQVNSTDSPITGAVVLNNTLTGAETGIQFSVPQERRTDLDIHSVVGQGVFGAARICHNGAPGSLNAETVHYKIRSTQPLDFEPVLQTPFKTRNQLK